MKADEGGTESSELFTSAKMTIGKKSIVMVYSKACNEKVSGKRPGDDDRGGAAETKTKA
jgi:hypothetical protein